MAAPFLVVLLVLPDLEGAVGEVGDGVGPDMAPSSFQLCDVLVRAIRWIIDR